MCLCVYECVCSVMSNSLLLNLCLLHLLHLQANSLAEWLVENYQIDVIYSSDLIRAHSTALPISNRFGIEIITSKKLREIYSGKWQGMDYSVIKEKYCINPKDIEEKV